MMMKHFQISPSSDKLCWTDYWYDLLQLRFPDFPIFSNIFCQVCPFPYCTTEKRNILTNCHQSSAVGLFLLYWLHSWPNHFIFHEISIFLNNFLLGEERCVWHLQRQEFTHTTLLGTSFITNCPVQRAANDEKTLRNWGKTFAIIDLAIISCG